MLPANTCAMLSPDAPTAGNSILSAYTNMIRLNSYVYTCNSIKFFKISPEPVWLPDVRKKLAMFTDHCALFINKKTELWDLVFTPFINYKILFTEFSANYKNHKTNAEQIEALKKLKKGLKAALAASQKAIAVYAEHYSDIKKIQSILRNTVNTEVNKLTEHEPVITELNSHLKKLQETIISMQNSFNSHSLTNGKNHIQSSIITEYKLKSNTATLPLLSYSGLAFTTDTFFDEIFGGDSRVSNILNDIYILELKTGLETQTAVAAKVILYFTHKLLSQFNAIQNNLQEIMQIWAMELNKIKQTISIVKNNGDAGVIFNNDMITIASQIWETLAGYSKKVQQPLLQGKAVNISI